MERSKDTTKTALKSADPDEPVELVVASDVAEPISNVVMISAALPALPSLEFVKFRSSSLTSAFSASQAAQETSSEGADRSDEPRKPLFTPGMVISVLWGLLVLVSCSVDFFRMHLPQSYWTISGSFILALSFASCCYWAFCINRLTKELSFKNDLQAQVCRSFYAIASLCYQPLFLGAAALFVIIAVSRCSSSYPGTNWQVVFNWATLLYFVLPATLSTSFFYWFTLRLQEQLCAASVTLVRRRATAAIVAACHVLPAALVLISYCMSFLIFYHFGHAWLHKLVSLLVMLSFAVCQYVPFKLFKSWLYSKTRDI
jgi:hypothetical protein